MYHASHSHYKNEDLALAWSLQGRRILSYAQSPPPGGEEGRARLPNLLAQQALRAVTLLTSSGGDIGEEIGKWEGKIAKLISTRWSAAETK